MDEEPAHKRFERLGEAIYEEMYGPGSPRSLLSEIKECFAAAIAAAAEAGLPEEAKRLEARLEHIIAVCRSQFS